MEGFERGIMGTHCEGEVFEDTRRDGEMIDYWKGLFEGGGPYLRHQIPRTQPSDTLLRRHLFPRHCNCTRPKCSKTEYWS